jgi:hypothetical protein
MGPISVANYFKEGYSDSTRFQMEVWLGAMLTIRTATPSKARDGAEFELVLANEMRELWNVQNAIK